MIRTSYLAAAFAVAAIVAGSAQADTVAKPSMPLEAAASTRAPTSGLNLLAPPREGTPVVRVRQMGTGSWICSPAGFGRRSRCYSN